MVELLLVLLALFSAAWVLRALIHSVTLVGCRGCRKQISRRATICPYCQTKRGAKRPVRR